jgi:hypothetical protein
MLVLSVQLAATPSGGFQVGSFVVIERLMASFGASSAPIPSQPDVNLAGSGFVLRVLMCSGCRLLPFWQMGSFGWFQVSYLNSSSFHAIRSAVCVRNTVIARW